MKKLICLFLLVLVGLVSSEKKLCSCRLPDWNERAKGNPVPWLSVLRENGQLICGSFIVNDRLLMTSASCVYNKTVESLDAITGTFDLSKARKDDVHRVESIKVHPLFNGTRHYDIGLVRLKKAITFERSRTESSCLELSYNNGYLNDELLLVGYGSNRPAGRNIPRRSHLKISEQMPIESRLIHGTLIDGSVCNGDIGGSLMYTYSSNLTYSVAINSCLSFTNENNQASCSKLGAYFTRLSGHRDFIAENVDIHC